MYKTDRVKAAAQQVINAMQGTPLNPYEFNPALKFNTLLINARTRRPWAVLNKKPILTAAIDNLIIELEK